MGRMSYEVRYLSWFESCVLETDKPVDNINVYKTYTEAKNRLIFYLKSDRDEIRSRISEVKKQLK